jgi:lipopolysaccharide transport system permease protein
LTPVVYPVSTLPDFARKLLLLNPMAPLMEAYQNIFIASAWPEWGKLWFIFVLGVLLCFTGVFLFIQHSSEMVDEL